MKKMCLYFFSGTGMTKYIVDNLSKEFEKQNITVDCFRIENTRNVVLSKYDIFGIAYPVHSFNAPQIVINFAKRLPKSNGLKTFIIHTAGEDHAINYSSSNLLIKKLNKKGYKVFYNKLIEMPSNFIVKYKTDRVNRIFVKANKAIPRIAKEIGVFVKIEM